jgi:hypothetical protein
MRCSSLAGFQGRSTFTTALAARRFNPTLPLPVERNSLHAKSCLKRMISAPALLQYRAGGAPDFNGPNPGLDCALRSFGGFQIFLLVLLGQLEPSSGDVLESPPVVVVHGLRKFQTSGSLGPIFLRGRSHCTPLLNCRRTDKHLAIIWVPRPESSCSRSLSEYRQFLLAKDERVGFYLAV